MSFFKFAYKVNVPSFVEHEPSVFFLNEGKEIVAKDDAHSFIVKQRTQSGFREFFGIINDPHFIIDSLDPKADLDANVIDEIKNGAYSLYGLDEDLILTVEEKAVPFYIPQNFVTISPNEFANMKRTQDQIAIAGRRRRETVYKHYKSHLLQSHVKTVAEVKCTSVADLYAYLNAGKQWKIGSEFYGYVDGLFETGGYLTTSIDTNTFSPFTATHELGHATSFFLTDELFNEWYQIAIDKSEEPISAYGHTEVSEDFAEAYGFYFTNKSTNDQLKKKCPIRYEYMTKLKQLDRAALLKSLKVTPQISQRFRMYDKVVYEA